MTWNIRRIWRCLARGGCLLTLCVGGCVPATEPPTTPEQPVAQVASVPATQPARVTDPEGWGPLEVDPPGPEDLDLPAATVLVPPPGRPADARPSPTMVYTVLVTPIRAPTGQISRNEAFWKPIDEQAIRPDAYDILYKNGIRVGIAPLRMLETLSPLVEANLERRRSSIVGFEARHMELSVQSGIPQQTVFHIDARHVLHGRTFDLCENVMYLSFETAPRKPGTVRLSLTPGVRTQRRRVEVSRLGRGEREIPYDSNETLFDLNLRVDLPIDHFLIVAPSAESVWSGSLGRLFFTDETGGERTERALLISVQTSTLNPRQP